MSERRHRWRWALAALIVAAVALARRTPTSRTPTDQWPPVPRAPGHGGVTA